MPLERSLRCSSPHPVITAALLPFGPLPHHAVPDRVQAVIRATISDPLHITGVPGQCRPGVHQPLATPAPLKPERLRVTNSGLQHRSDQRQPVDLPGVHLSGPVKPAPCSFEVPGGRATITACCVEHRVISDHLCGVRVQLPALQPFDDPGGLFRIAEIHPPGPVPLTTGGAGSDVKLIQQPDAPLRRTLRIWQAEIRDGRR